MFYNIATGANVMKLLRPYFMNVRNKLECSSMVGLSSLAYCLGTRLKGASIG